MREVPGREIERIPARRTRINSALPVPVPANLQDVLANYKINLGAERYRVKLII
jgi:hypothetical protein